MRISLRPARSTIVLLLACLIPLLLAAYVGDRPAETVWLHAPGWSRARLVGVTQVEAPAPIALDDAGSMYLLLTQPDGARVRPRVLALDRNVAVAWEQSFAIGQAEIAQPQILWDGRALRLLWLADQRLYAASLDSAGSVLTAPASLSGETPVDAYAAASDGRGRVAVWYAGPRESPGLYAAWLGDPAAPATLVDPAGYRPALRIDRAGALHAIWSVAIAPAGSEIYYAAYPDGIAHAGERRLMARLAAPDAGSKLDGPWFGTDDQHGYLLWTILHTSGLSAGRRLAQYTSFPLGRPAELPEIRPLSVPDGADLAYDIQRETALAAGPRVALAASTALGGIAPTAMSANPAAAPELALACEALVRYKYHQTVQQVGVLFFGAGAPTDYQLLSFDQRSAFTPALISDQSRQLYVTWRERRSPGYDVYLASTAPDITRSLSRLTLSDIARLAVDIFFGLLSGAVFAPFTALLWFVAPLLILSLTWFARREGSSVERWGTIASLTLAIGAYWAGKLVTFRAALDYVPFSGWLPAIWPWLALPLRIATPALIAIGALRLAWHYTYRVERRSALLFTLIYVMIDSLCTMAIYGGLLFGAFYPHAGGL